MGKWTSEQYDNVLGAKIKNLVYARHFTMAIPASHSTVLITSFCSFPLRLSTGAVKRSKLERLEPAISYEKFVEDLDPGDSFTTTLTELLVREMAERRQRQAADRRLISDRTAKGLRTLAAPQRVYRDRTGRGVAARRPLNLTDYLSVPPEDIDLDDDNDSLESMIDPSGAIEGTRMNSDLYDAYSNPGPPSTEPHISPATPHLRHMLRSATRREDWVLLRDTSPDGWAPPSPTAAPSAPPLTRQPSIRRLPARSRTVDFTDFTSRRRSSGREGNNAGPSAEPDADDSAAPVTTSSRLSPNTTSVPPRRFFPSRRPELPWSPAPESATPAPMQVDARSQRTFLSWLPSNALLSLPPPPPADLRSPRVAPRLRRGGVRPPESLLARPPPHVTMLRTTSPEPMAATPVAISAPADAIAGVGAAEVQSSSLSGDASTLTPEVVPVPMDALRAQSPTAAE
ncbi:hypothetical protein BC826DRAFT_1185707 [Russula brevipes]|nr:hypothetical protein BC826DRAFT_1185707 [Russula brevipes]